MCVCVCCGVEVGAVHSVVTYVMESMISDSVGFYILQKVVVL